MEINEQFIMANLHHLTHQRTGFKGAMLEPGDLESHCPLDNGRHDKQEIFSSLGNLETLPLELLHMILLDLDLQTLTSLRRVNRRTRYTLDTLRQYNEIISYAPHSLRAALSINVGSSISCRQLHKELCFQECIICSRFGAFLYLLTCSRVCYVCLVEDPRFLPLTPKHAGMEFGLTSSEIAKLPFASTIPGIYSHSAKVRRARTSLVDRTTSYKVGVRLHRSVEKMEDYVSKKHANRMSLYEVKVQKHRIEGLRNLPRPSYTDVFDGQGGNPYRFMCVARFPWLDRSRDKVEWGLNCSGCRDKFHDRTDGRQDWRWLYTTRGYLIHFRHCSKSVEALEQLM